MKRFTAVVLTGALFDLGTLVVTPAIAQAARAENAAKPCCEKQNSDGSIQAGKLKGKVVKSGDSGLLSETAPPATTSDDSARAARKGGYIMKHNGGQDVAMQVGVRATAVPGAATASTTRKRKAKPVTGMGGGKASLQDIH